VRRRIPARVPEGPHERRVGGGVLPRRRGRYRRARRMADEDPDADGRQRHGPMTDLDGTPASHDHRSLGRAELLDDPTDQFLRWLTEAEVAGIVLPNAVALATADKDARPSVRHVLLRVVDDRGFVFYTNHESRKGRQLAENPHAAIVVFWRELDRQISVTGRVERIAEDESDAYFATRPRGAQIGAWASPQSAVLDDRPQLDRRRAP